MPSKRKRSRELSLSVGASVSVTVFALLFVVAAAAPFLIELQPQAWRDANPSAATFAKGAYVVAEGLSMGAVFALTIKLFFKLSITNIVEVFRTVVAPRKVATSGEVIIRLTDMPPEGLQAMINTQTAEIRAEAEAVAAECEKLRADKDGLIKSHTYELAAANASLDQSRRQVASLEADNKTLKERVTSDSRTIQAARQQVEMLTGHEGNMREALKQLKADLDKAPRSTPPS